MKEPKPDEPIDIEPLIEAYELKELRHCSLSARRRRPPPPGEKAGDPPPGRPPEINQPEDDPIAPGPLTQLPGGGTISRDRELGTRDLWVLTRITDGSDPFWDERFTIFGTPEQVRSTVDLPRGVPFGWQLLKGKAARRFLSRMIRDEIRWRGDQEARGKSDQN